MNEWQDKREKNYKNFLLNLYSLCIIVFVTAFIIKFFWSLDFLPKDIYLFYKNVLTIIPFLLSTILGSALIIRFNATAGAVVLAIFVFVFIIGYQDIHFKTLLIIPVALASFARSKLFGSVVALGCGLLLCITDLYIYSNVNFPNKSLESDIIFTGVMFICAWLTGGIADIERDTRDLLLELANRDGLTGVYNHRFFHVYFKSLVEEVKNKNRSLSLVIFDVDYFKYYNDTFGHAAGDQILNSIGQILTGEITGPAIAARFGGDEFCILLPDCDTAAAYQIAKKIKQKTEALTIKHADQLPGGKMTLSIGLANYPEHTKSGEELLELADQALYKAKKTSKDKIELYFNVLDTLKNSSNQSEMELLSSVRTLLSIINAKDRYTYGHSERVLEYATLLAKSYGLSEEEVRFIQYGAYLHDIGKIEIDINILNAAGKITEDEWSILKKHPYWGSEIIRPIKSLEKARLYVLYHHENYDGTGYPQGIRGTEIPLGARIIRIADSFDAMTTDRPYKKGKSPEAACSEILSMAGSHYDPELARLFVKIVENLPENKKI